MNKNILLLLTFLVSMNASAQLTLNFGKNVYYKAEVELEDGTIKSGYVLDFQNKPVISNQMVNTLSAFNPKERNLGLANRFYHFRKDKNAKNEKIPISDIRSINLYKHNNLTNKETEHRFQKTKVAKFQKGDKIKYYNGDYLLPVYYSNAKLTIFHYNLVSCTNKDKSNCYVDPINFYFQANDNEYAILPIHVIGSDIFSPNNVALRFNNSIEYFGKNCPNFLNKYKEQLSDVTQLITTNNKNEYDDFIQFRTSYLEDLKKNKKKMKKKEYKIYAEERLEQYSTESANHFYNKVYDEIVSLYINNCE